VVLVVKVLAVTQVTQALKVLKVIQDRKVQQLTSKQLGATQQAVMSNTQTESYSSGTVGLIVMELRVFP
jgi:hypothetical protein